VGDLHPSVSARAASAAPAASFIPPIRQLELQLLHRLLFVEFTNQFTEDKSRSCDVIALEISATTSTKIAKAVRPSTMSRGVV